jgi:L-alanine-DL-glutamate epimerase-like enolase superfamily enzyme
MSTIKLASLEAYAFRVPISNPIKVAFGTFGDRPMVLVRAVEQDGSEGWGEVWCNWPSVTAEHRARLAADIGERLIGRAFQGPAQAFEQLTREMEVLALQTGEQGPIAAAIAGIDIALWDLAARRDGVPLHRYLGGDAGKTHVPVYVTGINPDAPEQFARARQLEGHRAFKLKVGFEMVKDLANLHAMRKALGADAVITCDANQAWSLAEATRFVREARGLDLQWLEEPMRVDAPDADWLALARESNIPLAGGENLQGMGFDDAIALGALQVIQPDVTKWGGITGNLRVARAAVVAGRRYCPHYFSGGLALLSSLHVLAAAGGTGLLEFDAHPNPNRESIVADLLPLVDGCVPIPTTPGLGAEPDLSALKHYRTWPT